jgi:hypothetical protein
MPSDPTVAHHKKTLDIAMLQQSINLGAEMLPETEPVAALT